MAMRQHDAIRPKDRVDGRCFGKKRMDRRIKFICPFDLAEHQGVEPWHRSPGLSHFECDLLRPLEYISMFFYYTVLPAFGQAKNLFY